MSGWYLLSHLFWLPAIAVTFRLIYRGKYPVASAAVSYFLGCLAVIPALLIQSVWNVHVPESPVANVVAVPLWACPVEEWAKLLAALGAARLLKEETNRRAFLALAVAASLGFAAAETVLFVMERGAHLLPIRVLISMPAHLSFTLFAAAGLAGSPSKEVSRRTFWGWWMLASAAHTAYSGPLAFDPDVSWCVPVGVMSTLLAASVALAAIRVKRRPLDRGKHRDQSPQF